MVHLIDKERKTLHDTNVKSNDSKVNPAAQHVNALKEIITIAKPQHLSSKQNLQPSPKPSPKPSPP